MARVKQAVATGFTEVFRLVGRVRNHAEAVGNRWIPRTNVYSALSPSMSRISSSVCKRLEGAFICVLGGITCGNDP